MANRAGSSSTSLTCGLPIDNNLSEFISAAFTGQRLSNLTLAYELGGSASSSSSAMAGRRYVEFMLTNPVVRDLQFSAQASSQASSKDQVEVTFGFSSLQLSLQGFSTTAVGKPAQSSYTLTPAQQP
jgi:hypothetical protein